MVETVHQQKKEILKEICLDIGGELYTLSSFAFCIRKYHDVFKYREKSANSACLLSSTDKVWRVEGGDAKRKPGATLLYDE